MTTNTELPEGSAATQGRARLVIINGEGRNGRVTSEMAMLSASGEVLWRGGIATGGWGNGALPGMDESRIGAGARGRAVVGEYRLNYASGQTDGFMAARPDKPSFNYANGQPGFSLGIDNASNIDELGGRGRNAFRIHPGGQRLAARGQDSNSEGCIKIDNDDQARAFIRTIMNLPESQRPASLEILNRRMTPTMDQAVARAPGAAAPQTAPVGEAEAEERRRRETAAEADRSGQASGITELFGQLLGWLFKWLFGGQEQGLNEGERDNTQVSTGERIRIGRQIISSGAQTAWESFRRQHAGERVNHINPVSDEVVVTSEMGHREAPRTAGGRRGSSEHRGLDLDTDNGNNRATIRASAAGVVLFAGNNGNGYGNHIIIGHADGTTSFYGHMASIQPDLIGREIGSGQAIGVMGTTGNSSGVHLHYEQRRLNRSGGMDAIDPIINGRRWEEGQRIAAAAGSVPNLAAAGVTGGQPQTEAPAAPLAVARTTGITIGGVRFG